MIRKPSNHPIQKPNLGSVQSIVAKSEDGTIQITFTVPYEIIKDEEKKALEILSKEVEIPGFRKGMAPLDKVNEFISKEKLIQKTLTSILPKALTEILNREKIKPIIYPKIELINAKENEPWQLRATTCELPNLELSNYKEVIIGEAKSNAIWTPEKDKTNEKPKEKTLEEKQALVLKTLLKTVKVNIPNILIQEEVNSRLAKLLERTEKLGLGLESYLTTIGKNPESIRKEYENQAKDSIIIELTLNKIAEEEKITIPEDKINEAIKVASTDPKLAEELKKLDQRAYIVSLLKRQEALSHLLALI